MQIKRPAEAILHQMPGIFAVKEVREKSYYNILNLTFAKMIGYDSVDEAIGLSDEDAKSDEIVENSETFYQHDRLVMAGKTIRTLDIYPYKISEIIGILAVKKPLLDDNNNICGVLAQGFPLKESDINKIIANITDFSNLSKKIDKSITKTYEIRNDLGFNLTKKEFECFFYLLRGKSNTEISNILCRSSRTIETHVENIKNKLGLNKRTELFDFAYAHGLINIIPYTLVSGTRALDI